MIDLWISYALVVIGLVYLLTQSTIFAPLRMIFRETIGKFPLGGHFLAVLIYCPTCSAFWFGCGVQKFFNMYPVNSFHPILESGVAAVGLLTLVKGSFDVDRWTLESLEDDKASEASNERTK